jgi:hypothetical protein
MLPVVVLLVLVALAVAGLAVRRRGAPAALAPAPVSPVVAPVRPRTTVLAEAVPAPARISGEVAPRPTPLLVPPPRLGSSSDALETLDALLSALESTTVRIDGADEFDEGAVAELEGLAERLEAAADSIAGR